MPPLYRDTRSSRTGELRHDGELIIHPEKHQQTAKLSELLAATGRVTRPRETPTNQHPTNCRTQRTTRCYWQSYTTQRNSNRLPNSANYSLLLAELHDPEKQQQTAELSELLAATGRVTRPRETATDCRTQRTTRCYWQSYTTQRNSNRLPNSAREPRRTTRCYWQSYTPRETVTNLPNSARELDNSVMADSQKYLVLPHERQGGLQPPQSWLFEERERRVY